MCYFCFFWCRTVRSLIFVVYFLNRLEILHIGNFRRVYFMAQFLSMHCKLWDLNFLASISKTWNTWNVKTCKFLRYFPLKCHVFDKIYCVMSEYVLLLNIRIFISVCRNEASFYKRGISWSCDKSQILTWAHEIWFHWPAWELKLNDSTLTSVIRTYYLVLDVTGERNTVPYFFHLSHNHNYYETIIK